MDVRLMPPFRDQPAELDSPPRLEAFGYICRRCSRCCHHKDIQVNPYEIARLARQRGQTTTEFRAAWTREGSGAMLKQTEAGACVFLGENGCTVHPDRPLVCRLYPLGRHLLSDGTEWFSHIEPHPQSAGERTKRGTIAEYIDKQEAAPFLIAADAYFSWLCAASDCLGGERVATGSEPAPEDAQSASDLMDLDAAVADHCR